MNLCKVFMKKQNLFDLAKEAREMLLDRSKQEQDLIYLICKMDSELRAAIMLAYQGMKNE